MIPDPAAGFILPVDKPAGPTSHDVVDAARRALRIRRIGHTGTLDPFATGLLLLCVGVATRLAEYFSDLPKTYVARMRLGTTTDTDDATGQVTGTSDGWTGLDEATLEAALARQTGEILQTPPAYSARKVGGERLYRAARRGEIVEAPPSRVTVHRLALKQMLLPDVDLEITCGSGTYIRSIARDTGNDLGVGAYLVTLRRTRIGAFVADAACGLDELDRPERVTAARVEMAAALAHVPAIEVGADAVAALRHGRRVEAPSDGAPAGAVTIVHDGVLVAMGEAIDGWVHPKKVLVG